MIKIIAKKGTYRQKVDGVAPIVMHEISTMVSHLIHNDKTTKTQEKLMGFAAMLGIAQVFTKSEMLELLHDACESKDPDSTIFEYYRKVLAEKNGMNAQNLTAIADAIDALCKNLNKGPEKKPDLMC